MHTEDVMQAEIYSITKPDDYIQCNREVTAAQSRRPSSAQS